MDDNCVDRPKLITDSYREDRYEVTAKLAYEHWEKEAARWARLMLIGMRLKPRCVSTWRLQALRSVPTFLLLNRTIRIKLPANPLRDYCPDLRCRPGTGNSSTCSLRSRSSRCALGRYHLK